MLTAAILAGGRARRFGGRNKGALPVGDRTILDRQLGVLRELTPNILIIGDGDPDRARPGVEAVSDHIPGAGALGGLYTALTAAPTEPVLVLACDMPFLTLPFLAWLGALPPGFDARVPSDEWGLHPLCACYTRRAAAHLRTCIDDDRLAVVDAMAGLQVQRLHTDDLRRFDPARRLLYNVNTPEDYQQALMVARAEHLLPRGA